MFIYIVLYVYIYYTPVTYLLKYRMYICDMYWTQCVYTVYTHTQCSCNYVCSAGCSGCLLK